MGIGTIPQLMADEAILREVLNERASQIIKHGYTPDADDQNNDLADFVTYIGQHTQYALVHQRYNGPKFRREMVQIAALAVAAIASYDRKVPS